MLLLSKVSTVRCSVHENRPFFFDSFFDSFYSFCSEKFDSFFDSFSQGPKNSIVFSIVGGFGFWRSKSFENTLHFIILEVQIALKMKEIDGRE